MKNIPLLLATLIGTVLLVFVVAFVFSKKASAPVDTVKLAADSRLATGSAQPKVTIVEFSDFQCPACKAAEPLVKQLVVKNKDAVKFVYRHFPLTQHQNSMAAALAAETAASVSIPKFWEMHDLLFEKQEEWSPQKADEVIKTFGTYAERLGIPADLMEKSIQGKVFRSKVDIDVAAASTFGVSSTPTFYVNGQKVQMTDLQSAVEKLLQQ